MDRFPAGTDGRHWVIDITDIPPESDLAKMAGKIFNAAFDEDPDRS